MLRLGDLWTTSLTGVAELTSLVEPRRRTSAWLQVQGYPISCSIFDPSDPPAFKCKMSDQGSLGVIETCLTTNVL